MSTAEEVIRSARQRYQEAAAVGHDVVMPDGPIGSYDFSRYLIDFLQHQNFFAEVCARHHDDLLALALHRFLVQEAAARAFDDAQLAVMLKGEPSDPVDPPAPAPAVPEPTYSDESPRGGFWMRSLKACGWLVNPFRAGRNNRQVT